MTLNLSNLKPAKGSKHKKKTIGRGGKRGTYSGRGLKGQKARSGGKRGLKRLGMRQLIERTHKLRGFQSIHPKPAIISLRQINKNFQAGDTVSPESLMAKKLVANATHGVKVLSDGSININIKLTGCAFSKKAAEKIKAAGGEIIQTVANASVPAPAEQAGISQA
ncbi:50S ribosomal protein L15 [Candidatus Kuenenbacteria bacterium RIFCSPLOWO2_12_FULL_42_13]|uniref:Large ribosomal subunit protein uL15 n=5 Tax=Candidatus Kueneniibacteriota TaxID=1752740 RepID=A0A0G0Z249_9BACT|nr:MAG: 50S ribosomal protein L15 [Candidatus Kuenenbacteria bacterium GW2011_GWA2_42_15]OGG89428.1 MAG: 50S ribosomal protein L15 [Candidatus Kuenenbacteria bacterium RIFCSPHIGHO2_02_FULL_42_29]OGG89786.1 MAG: 50S ribosomal protein L15 [Candidatus Kuenenbacteria bacterium RIFCSPLOWO2_02_FULL_42_16]OGG91701.1 MAG: 50S ribosomal protein L15 [Candidatus Kuenenbacteria bacterium RIFCSPLOWO2_12_FULL_42_13]OGG95883.1 MAG: 50S ribosomal protein L15 [Candidatus Kuenenbacteria bacterium RBG_16_41_7]OG